MRRLNLRRLLLLALRMLLVITVAFDLDDDETEERLSDCATSEGYFYIAEDNEALASAFDAITNQLATALYISK